jgi:hypothetical protein
VKRWFERFSAGSDGANRRYRPYLQYRKWDPWRGTLGLWERGRKETLELLAAQYLGTSSPPGPLQYLSC